ncbi:MAG: hypothetical protein IKG18_08155 [Atopobiaceae bacterium]|nr:hypothetical protein [Atopobiaceae bacterium]
MKYEFLATLSFDDTDDLINTATSFVTGMINAGVERGNVGRFFLCRFRPRVETRLGFNRQTRRYGFVRARACG